MVHIGHQLLRTPFSWKLLTDKISKWVHVFIQKGFIQPISELHFTLLILHFHGTEMESELREKMMERDCWGSEEKQVDMNYTQRDTKSNGYLLTMSRRVCEYCVMHSHVIGLHWQFAPAPARERLMPRGLETLASDLTFWPRLRWQDFGLNLGLVVRALARPLGDFNFQRLGLGHGTSRDLQASRLEI